jgi:hypothetical protein
METGSLADDFPWLSPHRKWGPFFLGANHIDHFWSIPSMVGMKLRVLRCLKFLSNPQKSCWFAQERDTATISTFIQLPGVQLSTEFTTGPKCRAYQVVEFVWVTMSNTSMSEKLQETNLVHRKIHGFRWRFPPKAIQKYLQRWTSALPRTYFLSPKVKHIEAWRNS